jgi:hypothetical protein
MNEPAAAGIVSTEKGVEFRKWPVGADGHQTEKATDQRRTLEQTK